LQHHSHSSRRKYREKEKTEIKIFTRRYKQNINNPDLLLLRYKSKEIRNQDTKQSLNIQQFAVKKTFSEYSKKNRKQRNNRTYKTDFIGITFVL